MYAIVYTLLIAGHLFTVPGHSRFAYGYQCEAHLAQAAKSVISKKHNAHLVSTECKIMQDDVRI